jgi:hypothetical protein
VAPNSRAAVFHMTSRVSKWPQITSICTATERKNKKGPSRIRTGDGRFAIRCHDSPTIDQLITNCRGFSNSARIVVPPRRLQILRGQTWWILHPTHGWTWMATWAGPGAKRAAVSGQRHVLTFPLLFSKKPDLGHRGGYGSSSLGGADERPVGQSLAYVRPKRDRRANGDRQTNPGRFGSTPRS